MQSPVEQPKQRAYAGAYVRRAVRGVWLNNCRYTFGSGTIGLTFAESGRVWYLAPLPRVLVFLIAMEGGGYRATMVRPSEGAPCVLLWNSKPLVQMLVKGACFT